MPGALAGSARLLMSECTRIVNGMKADLTRLGVRNFNPKLRKASEKLGAACTPEGGPIPPNTAAKLLRDMARLHQIKEQIKHIEAERLEQMKKSPEEKAHVMILLLAQVIGLGIETADMLVREALSRRLRGRRAVARLAGLTGSPDESGSKRREKGSPQQVGAATHRHDPIGLAHAGVPEGECPCAMVPDPDSRWWSQNAKNYDCGTRPQVAHRPVAHGDDR